MAWCDSATSELDSYGGALLPKRGNTKHISKWPRILRNPGLRSIYARMSLAAMLRPMARLQLSENCLGFCKGYSADELITLVRQMVTMSGVCPWSLLAWTSQRHLTTFAFLGCGALCPALAFPKPPSRPSIFSLALALFRSPPKLAAPRYSTLRQNYAGGGRGRCDEVRQPHRTAEK